MGGKIVSLHSEPIKLLIIDDDLCFQHEAENLLMRCCPDCIVHLASKGYEGLIKAEKNDYHLILVDISLPDVSGADLVDELRAWELKNNRELVPVIGLTTCMGHVSLQLGMQTVLFKPIMAAEVDRMLEKYVYERI